MNDKINRHKLILVIVSLIITISLVACSKTALQEYGESPINVVSLKPEVENTASITEAPLPTEVLEVTKEPLLQEAIENTNTVTPSPKLYSVDRETALNYIKKYFEEVENRIFEVTSTEMIEDVECYIITISGKTDYLTYPIDKFAVSTVNLDTTRGYFWDQEKGEYIIFYTDPYFACKTSPNGKLRCESIGMYLDGPSGLHALREMRIIDTITGDVKWSSESYLLNNFIWSPDGRFVSVQKSGRTWTNTEVIDTMNMSVIQLPNVGDILEVDPTQPKAFNDYAYFHALEWISDTVLSVGFEWTTEAGSEVVGRYDYDVLEKNMNLKEISTSEY